MTLQPYPAYKDTGVPWPGEVPEHWDVQSYNGFITWRLLQYPYNTSGTFLELPARGY